eukprot:1150235-Pelagomonas_calceolata.AAC.2
MPVQVLSHRCNKLVTTCRRAIQNKSTSGSQVMELGASNNPPDPIRNGHADCEQVSMHAVGQVPVV